MRYLRAPFAVNGGNTAEEDIHYADSAAPVCHPPQKRYPRCSTLPDNAYTTAKVHFIVNLLCQV